MPYSRNVTECRGRNNEMLRDDIRTDLGTGRNFCNILLHAVS